MRRYFSISPERASAAQVAVLRHGVGGALAAVRQLRVLLLEVFADRFQGVASDGTCSGAAHTATQSPRMPPDSAAVIQLGATVTSAAEAAGNVSDPSATAAAPQTTVRATAVADGRRVPVARADPALIAASKSASVAPHAQEDQRCAVTSQATAVAAHAPAARSLFLQPASAHATLRASALPATASGSPPKAPKAAPPTADQSAAFWKLE